MKFNTVYKMGLLFALVLIIGLSACSPSSTPVNITPGVNESDSPTPVETQSVEPSSTEELVSQVPTPTILILDGAVTTDSGLQYLEEVAGDGSAPQIGDILQLHFAGTLPDGTPFGDSYSRGEPITALYGRNQLFPGWEEGVGLMKAGGKAKLVIPAELAFGEQGLGSLVPPNTPIVMEVELLSVTPPPTPTDVSEADLSETESGVQYYDIVEGDGDEAETDGLVTTHFTIWLKDGEQFIYDSQDREPVSFTLGSGSTVFPGWDEGVLGMKVGGKRLLIIPADLALGAQGDSLIPPNSDLIMEVDLVEVREASVQTEVDPQDYITTESGLKYYDIVEGDGATAEAGQSVVVHYSGWLEDGTKFDSSVDRGEPFSFDLGSGSVIQGWDEGVAGMKVGGKRQLVIPAELGYGETGSGIIPPGAILIFDVELLEVP